MASKITSAPQPVRTWEALQTNLQTAVDSTKTAVVKNVAEGVRSAAIKMDEYSRTEPANKLFSKRSLLEIGRDILAKIFPKPKEDKAGAAFLEETADFRQTLDLGKALSKQMEGLKPEDPRRAKLQKALETANTHLKQISGYSLDSAPKAGSLWIDPKYMDEALPDVKLNAKNFPTKPASTKAPAAIDAVFLGKPSAKIEDAIGKIVSVQNAAEYKAQVAANRKASGMPRTDGEPIGVHLTLQGGGGQGKRDAAAVAEMTKNGIVPVSISGASSGSMGAAFLAAGATAQDLDRFAKDPKLGKLFDLGLLPDEGGILRGEKIFELVDQELRRLTGIHDRPVTFADLKIPVQIVAAKMSDSAPPKGKEDMSQLKNRLFVFSQETTPDTPVALAVRASVAIPGFFDPVRVVDPVSGRKITLVDGGVLDLLPMNYHEKGLPEVGLSLIDRGESHPDQISMKQRPIPSGDIDATRMPLNGLNGYLLYHTGGGQIDDCKDRNHPEAGNFMLQLPTWNLQNPKEKNSVFGFKYDHDVDPELDAQTRDVTRNFFQQHLTKLTDPQAKATNSYSEIPKNFRFETPLEYDGKKFHAVYEGDDRIKISSGGKTKTFKLKRQEAEEMYLDNQAFGDLKHQLIHEFRGKLRRF